MPKRKQALADDAEEDLGALRVNKEFAKKYEERKRHEILSNMDPEMRQQLEEESGTDSEDDEEEDEFGELLTKKIDAQIVRTLDALRNKNPAIYNKKTVYFEGSRNDVDAPNDDEDEDDESSVNSEDEPVAGWDTIAKAAEESAPKLTIKDYVRETLLKEGELPDSDEERFTRRRHVEEEDEEVVKSTTKLREEEEEEDSDDSSSDEDEKDSDQSKEDESSEEEDDDENAKAASAADNGKKKKSTAVNDEDESGKEAEEQDDDDDESDDNDEEDFFTVKKKTKEELEQEERDFAKYSKQLAATKATDMNESTLLHSYLKESSEKKDKFLRDFVMNNGWLDETDRAPGSRNYGAEKNLKVGEAEDEDEFDDRVDDFEAEHNFRFEDPDSARVMSYSRGGVSNSMRRPDERRKKAREARKQRKNKEKHLKSEEIKQLKNIKKKEIQARLLALQDAAGEDVDLTGIDLDADFDPDTFGKEMEAKFGDEYYAQNDADLERRKDSDENDNNDRSGKKPNASEMVDENDREMEQAVDKLMDEYYNLDYEDIIDGEPVRFKYKSVDAQDFGMTAEEILGEEDKTLNQRASLKYLAPYRDRKEVRARAKTARWKKKYGGHDGHGGTSKRKQPDGEQLQEDATVQKKPRKKRRHGRKNKAEGSAVESGNTQE